MVQIFKLQYQNLTSEFLSFMANKPLDNRTFQSIKQKYSQNIKTPSWSPLKNQTSISHKENYIQYQQPKYDTADKLSLNSISPLTIKSFNQSDSSQLKIDEIKNRLKGYETARQQLMTQRTHSQRALNKESVPLTKRSFYLPQTQDDAKQSINPVLSSKTKNDPNRSSPICKYFQVRTIQEGAKSTEKYNLDEQMKEKQLKYKKQREENYQTITSVQNIMNNIRAALRDRLPKSDC